MFVGCRTRACAWSRRYCHDDEKIYVHQVAHEKNIRAELTDKLGSICTDSCMEFFFSPVPEDGRYFNIELNLNGAIFLGFGHGRADSIRLIPEDHKKLFQHPHEQNGGRVGNLL